MMLASIQHHLLVGRILRLLIALAVGRENEETDVVVEDGFSATCVFSLWRLCSTNFDFSE